MGVQEVTWDKGVRVRAGEYNFLYDKGNENHQLRAGFFVHHRITPADKRVESDVDRVSYRVLRGRWCSVTVLNVLVPGEERSDGQYV